MPNFSGQVPVHSSKRLIAYLDEVAPDLSRVVRELSFGMSADAVQPTTRRLPKEYQLDPDEYGLVFWFHEGPSRENLTLESFDILIPNALVGSFHSHFRTKERDDRSVWVDAGAGIRIVINDHAYRSYQVAKVERYMAPESLFAAETGLFPWEPEGGLLGASIQDVEVRLGRYRDGNGFALPALKNPSSRPRLRLITAAERVIAFEFWMWVDPTEREDWIARFTAHLSDGGPNEPVRFDSKPAIVVRDSPLVVITADGIDLKVRAELPGIEPAFSSELASLAEGLFGLSRLGKCEEELPKIGAAPDEEDDGSYRWESEVEDSTHRFEMTCRDNGELWRIIVEEEARGRAETFKIDSTALELMDLTRGEAWVRLGRGGDALNSVRYDIGMDGKPTSDDPAAAILTLKFSRVGTVEEMEVRWYPQPGEPTHR